MSAELADLLSEIPNMGLQRIVRRRTNIGEYQGDGERFRSSDFSQRLVHFLVDRGIEDIFHRECSLQGAAYEKPSSLIITGRTVTIEEYRLGTGKGGKAPVA